MLATQMSYGFQPLCYHHEIEMKPSHILLTTKDEVNHRLAFACPKAHCLVHYSSARGYFTHVQEGNGNGIEPEPVPRVRCERDLTPMFLSELLPGSRMTLRLWKCPLCKTVRANAEVPAA